MRNPLQNKEKTNVYALLKQDLVHILEHTRAMWENLRGKMVFVTGGTGFFGKWLLESFLYANDQLKLDAQMLVLSRDPDSFKKQYPYFTEALGITFCKGDVRSFDFPRERFDFIIHAAADASVKLNIENPLLMLDTLVEGTRRALEFSRFCGAKRFLLISSGAVYGKQPPDLSHMQEDFAGAPDTAQPSSAYGEAKRIAELMCAIYQKQYGLRITVARCFAFVGPYLNLDIHYAVGNFIRDALAGGPIYVSGDGTPYRSYLYAADLAIWLWTLLFQGEPGEVYNVGSEESMTVAEIAHTVAQCFHKPVDVIIVKKAAPRNPLERYVPSTKRAREHCNLRQIIGLNDSITRTILYHQCDI